MYLRPMVSPLTLRSGGLDVPFFFIPISNAALFRKKEEGRRENERRGRRTRKQVGMDRKYQSSISHGGEGREGEKWP